MLFCKFCLHGVDIFRIDTSKNHITSDQIKNLFSKSFPKSHLNWSRKQSLLLLKSKEVQDICAWYFVWHSLLMHTETYTRKIDIMRQFILMQCKKSDAIPSVSCVRQLYLPKLFVTLLPWKPSLLINQSAS